SAISAGGAHVLALTSSGSVIAWGDQTAGQVGRAVNAGMQMPGPVPLIANARAVLAMSLSSLAVLADGTIMAWGILPTLAFRVDGADASASHFPVPLIVKGL